MKLEKILFNYLSIYCLAGKDDETGEDLIQLSIYNLYRLGCW